MSQVAGSIKTVTRHDCSVQHILMFLVFADIVGGAAVVDGSWSMSAVEHKNKVSHLTLLPAGRTQVNCSL